MSPKLATDLSPKRRELFSLLLKKKGIEIPQQQPIPRRGNVRLLPLSFAQERLWFLDQLDPGNANYNVPGAVRLTGRLNVAALNQSLSEIIRRHESLRTTFAAPEGKPFQVIDPATPLVLPVIDLTEMPRVEGEAEAVRLATEESKKPFDLARGPLFRAFLVQMSQEAHILVLNFHHIITDGWSMGVFTRELSQHYQAFCNNDPSPLPELPIQYADFALWQRERMRGEVLDAQLSYWKEQLGHNLPRLRLPTDRPRPPVQSYCGKHQPLALSKSITGALKRLARREGVTLFVTLLAAFKTLLYRYTGQEDIIVGSAFANRDRSELEGLIGFFVNTLPLRTRLSGNPSFRELLSRVSEITLDASTHRELPLAKLVKELKIERDLSSNPLFQVEFALLTLDHNPAVYGYGMSSAATEILELPGLTVSPLDVESEVARFDIAVFIWDLPEGLAGVFEYSTDLFEAATIARMVEHFQTLLQHVVAEPEVELSTLVAQLNELDKQQQIHNQKKYKETIRQKLKRIKRKSVRR